MHHTRWEDAVSLMHQRGTRAAQTHERVGLADAIGRILAEDVYTLVPLPHYNSSAMDGYAVSGSGSWILKDTEEPSAHENRHCRTVDLQDGEAATILTGGLIPPRDNYSNPAGVGSLGRAGWLNASGFGLW